jgi:translation initiation factor IF-2
MGTRAMAVSIRKRPNHDGKAEAYGKRGKARLSVVLKADTAGTAEALISGLEALQTGDVIVDLIRSGIGNISKSDLLMAETGSRLVVGFNVELLPKIRETAIERRIEIRLYDVIYRLMNDIKEIAASMIPRETEVERITGSARVIALFPGGHKGVILGCHVLGGALTLGKKFRLISDPGTVYTGTIDSLHIETRAVKEASVGQHVGLRIPNFKRAKKGDIVECFETIQSRIPQWQPRPGVFDMRSGPP